MSAFAVGKRATSAVAGIFERRCLTQFYIRGLIYSRDFGCYKSGDLQKKLIQLKELISIPFKKLYSHAFLSSVFSVFYGPIIVALKSVH